MRVAVFSSGWWCRRRSSSVKPLVPTLCLGVAVIYGLADKLQNFVADVFVPQYHYPYAVALCFAQVGDCFNTKSATMKSVIAANIIRAA